MLQIGSHHFSSPLIQGPLAGISAAPFRRLAWQYGNPAYCCTEMISCNTLLHKSLAAQSRFLYKHPDEGPLCFQLAANDPKTLGLATKIVSDHGADFIDLNCGCPVKKLRRKGRGSGLLQQPQLLHQLIMAMKQNTHVPVGIKIRVEGGSQDRFHSDILRVIEDTAIDFLVVHGRHWTEHYETPCHYDHIHYFVQQLRHLNIPIIGNGDVACAESLAKMQATKCDGVMIARAGVGQPWLTKSFTSPPLAQRGDMFIQHILDLAELLQSAHFAMIQARRFAKYYARHTTWQKDFTLQVNTANSLNELEKITQHFFQINPQ